MSEYSRSGQEPTKWPSYNGPVHGCKSTYVDPNRPALFISLHRKPTRRERLMQWLRDLDESDTGRVLYYGSLLLCGIITVGLYLAAIIVDVVR